MPKKEKTKKDECIQLKNINYQSMLQKKNTPIDSGKMETEDINKYLDQEQTKGNRQHKAWSKLEKGLKQKKLYIYVEKLSKKHNLNVKELINLKKYIKTQLERKKLQRIKDVIYDSEKGTIIDIPGLTFNNENRKFILRKVDKKGSTLKSLAPKANCQMHLGNWWNPLKPWWGALNLFVCNPPYIPKAVFAALATHQLLALGSVPWVAPETLIVNHDQGVAGRDRIYFQARLF